MKQTMSKIKKVLFFSIDILLITIVLSLGAFLIVNDSDQLPIQLRVVLSDSMAEVFPSKSLIIVKKMDPGKLKKGDIISYQANQDVVSHRIVEIKNGIFITKGDNNKMIDTEPISANQIIGKVIGHVRYIGSFFLKIQSKIGKLALVLTIIDFWILKLFLQILFEKEPLKKELEYEITN